MVFVPSLQDTPLTNQRDISPWSGVGLSGVEVRLTPLSRSLSLSLGPNAKERSDRNLPTIDRSVFVCCCCCVGALVSFSAPPHSSLPLCGAAGHVLSISVSPRHHQHHRNLPQLLINPLPRSLARNESSTTRFCWHHHGIAPRSECAPAQRTHRMVRACLSICLGINTNHSSLDSRTHDHHARSLAPQDVPE